MSEAELHIIRARLDGGIRNKAARGELKRGLPVGFIWGELDGEVLFHPDESVTGAIRTVFERFAEFGSARRVWLWFRSEGLPFPLQNGRLAGLARSAGSFRLTPHCTVVRRSRRPRHSHDISGWFLRFPAAWRAEAAVR